MFHALLTWMIMAEGVIILLAVVWMLWDLWQN